jgi:hypothetical protein
MFLNIKDFIISKYLKGEISKTRADEMIGVITLETKGIKTEQDFQEVIRKLTKTQFPELKDFFKAYRMKASEWLSDNAIDRVDELIDEGKIKEAEMVMGILEQMEEEN